MLFGPSKILLPPEGFDHEKWAVVACDQFTSQPEYWEKAEALVGSAPSTLHIILPEAYLEQPGVAERTQKIQDTMIKYLAKTLTYSLDGFVYVERTMDSGAIRQGLVGAVDLEEYSYQPGAVPQIRPSENTVVERIPPRLAVRRNAAIESPHILMLIDDADKGVIEPLGEKAKSLQKLYEGELMLGGGRIRGWAVTAPQDIAAIQNALNQLGDSDTFYEKYNIDAGASVKPFIMAVGDGNHSLASAKALWEEIKPTLTEAERKEHPARFCLVELENVQSEAIEIESIHRVLFDADPEDLWDAVLKYAAQQGAVCARVDAGAVAGNGEQIFKILRPGHAEPTWLSVINSPQPLAAGSFETFYKKYAAENPNVRVDYIHGEDSVAQLTSLGAIGVILPPFQKEDLFRGVALGGVLPKKTFSMGHANEKRYYLECRKIVKD